MVCTPRHLRNFEIKGPFLQAGQTIWCFLSYFEYFEKNGVFCSGWQNSLVSSVQGGKIVWCSVQGGLKVWCLLFTLAKIAWCLLTLVSFVWLLFDRICSCFAFSHSAYNLSHSACSHCAYSHSTYT